MREMGLMEKIRLQSRYESLTWEPYETLWAINSLLIPGNLYTPKTGAAE